MTPQVTFETASTVQRHRDRGLLLIAVFKLAKFVLLAAIGFGALQLLRPDVAQWAEARAAELELNDERRVLQLVLDRATDLSDARLRAIGIGCLAYSVIFLVEGIGLAFERRWAEYLTIIATGSLIPIELYEIARHATPGKFAILAVNIVIVGYLAFRLRQQRAEAESAIRE